MKNFDYLNDQIESSNEVCFEQFIDQVKDWFTSKYEVSWDNKDYQRYLFAVVKHPITQVVVKIYFRYGSMAIPDPLNTFVVRKVEEHFASDCEEDLEINVLKENNRDTIQTNT